MFIYFALGFFTVSFFLNCWFLFVSIRKLNQKNKVLSERNWFLSSQLKSCHHDIEIERYHNNGLRKDIEYLRVELAKGNEEIKRLKNIINRK